MNSKHLSGNASTARMAILLIFIWGAWEQHGLSAIEVRAGVPEEEWVVVLEPSFLRAPVGRALAGSKSTLLVAATLVENEPRRFQSAEFKALEIDWETFLTRASQNAERVLEKLKPQPVRDSGGILTHMVLRSSDPLTAGTILAPGFLKKFSETLGPEILVAVPNRHTVFVFPKLAGPHKEFGETVLFEYHNSAWPCSLELFEINSEGIRAAGSYAPDR